MSTRLSLLVDLASLLAREVDLDALLGTACERVAAALSAERATIWLVDAERDELVTTVALLPEVPHLRQPKDRGIAGYVARTGETVRIDDVSADARFDPTSDRATGFVTRSMLVAPIRTDTGAPVLGVLQLLNRTSEVAAFDEEDERYVQALAAQLARALSFTTLRAEREGPGLVLRGPINHIVGRSPGLARVYDTVARSAETDVPVLLRGETGTGKGLFARAVHVNSKRQAGPFVTLDCTTLPSQLVESELFGHERGAFTGADRRVPGKIELAQGGTLFIDEIAELPVENQGKLLRVLQDRTFERVGGRETLRADVRIVCATHKNLEDLVAAGKFREDLYYRVRVVEIELPSLRERGDEELERLVAHFIAMYAERYGRNVKRLSAAAWTRVRAHRFPGNVRELEHWVECGVVLSDGEELGAEALPGDRGKNVQNTSVQSTGIAAAVNIVPPGLTLDDAMRLYAEDAVARAGGNRTAAAKTLGIGRNTLARMLGGSD